MRGLALDAVEANARKKGGISARRLLTGRNNDLLREMLMAR